MYCNEKLQTPTPLRAPPAGIASHTREDLDMLLKNCWEFEFVKSKYICDNTI